MPASLLSGAVIDPFSQALEQAEALRRTIAVRHVRDSGDDAGTLATASGPACVPDTASHDDAAWMRASLKPPGHRGRREGSGRAIAIDLAHHGWAVAVPFDPIPIAGRWRSHS